MSSILVPLKTRRVGQRCKLNLSRAEMSSRWSAFGDEYPCGATVFRIVHHNSLQDEEQTEMPWQAVIPDNVSAIRKMLMEDNRCTYQMIQKELDFGSTAIYKIIHELLHMNKKYDIDQSHEVGRTEDSNSKLIYH
ncbi:histone-lysine N-methyltransferase SETMAR [Trichonephila clavipes]|nr:histone-lysine N-methyltransferase SETMAR [Trichonephila clavipes]